MSINAFIYTCVKKSKTLKTVRSYTKFNCPIKKIGSEIPKTKVLLSILIYLIACQQHVYSQTIERIAIPGGRVSALAVAPANSGIIYCTTEEGFLFKSNNAGETSVVLANIASDEIHVDPEDGDIIYISNLRSTNGGINWEKLEKGGYMAINPLNPRRIFCSSYGEIWVSDDRGDTWKLESKLDLSRKIAIAPSDTNILYLEGSISLFGYGIYKSTDGGLTWNFTGLRLEGSDVSAICVSPSNSSIVYVGTKEGIYRTTDGGQTWENILKKPYINDIAIDHVCPQVVYAVNGNYLCGITGHVFKSDDGGNLWEVLDHGLPIAEDRFIYEIEMAPKSSSELYIGTYGYGVFKSTDGGNSWEWTDISFAPISYIYVDTFHNGHMYVSTWDEGVLFSVDGGNNWERVDFGVPTVQTFFGEILIAERDFYVAGGTWGLFRSTDGGATWNLTSLRGSFDTLVKCVNVHPRNPEMIYAGTLGCFGGELYMSEDGGLTWNSLGIQDAYEGANIEEFLFDPLDPSVIYVAAHDLGILKGEDGGLIWENILPNQDSMDVGPPFTSVAIAIRNDSSRSLYAAQQASGNKRGAVYLSGDGGKKWKKISSELEKIDKNVSVVDIAISPLNSNRVYVSLKNHGMYDWGSPGGFFFTDDSGSTWMKLYEGSCGFFTIDPSNPKIIYISTQAGIIKLTDLSLSVIDNCDKTIRYGFKLFRNFPNPFNSETKIKFHILEPSYVKLRVYDLLGREIITLLEKQLSPGYYEVLWDGKDEFNNDLPTGVYLYELETHKGSRFGKLTKLK